MFKLFMLRSNERLLLRSIMPAPVRENLSTVFGAMLYLRKTTVFKVFKIYYRVILYIGWII
jgi:hypothetical protein